MLYVNAVYLGSANVKTQHLRSYLQRLCMEDLSYHPKTCLDKTHTHKERLQHQTTLTNSPKTDWDSADMMTLFHMLHSSKHNKDFRYVERKTGSSAL